LVVDVGDAAGDDLYGGMPSLARSALGTVHIAYQHRVGFNGAEVRYAKGNAEGFDVETVASGNYKDFGKYTRLIVDPIGGVHLAYRAGTSPSQPTVEHAIPSADDWLIQTMADSASLWAYEGTDFALTATITGDPAIAYPSSVRLSYAYTVGFTLEKTTVSQVSGHSYTDPPAAQLDEDGLVHIAYLHYPNSTKTLSMASGGEASWQSTALDPSVMGVSNTRMDLAIASSGKLAVCYFTKDPSGEIGLRVALETESGWVLETADSVGRQSCSMALDSLDRPHVVYRGENGDLRYARRSLLNTWEVESVIQPEGVGKYGYRWPSMALSSTGDVHVAVWEQDTGTVKYVFVPGQ
jgi:hypothetical protein